MDHGDAGGPPSGYSMIALIVISTVVSISAIRRGQPELAYFFLAFFVAFPLIVGLLIGGFRKLFSFKD